jgi:hypothetical protein
MTFNECRLRGNLSTGCHIPLWVGNRQSQNFPERLLARRIETLTAFSSHDTHHTNHNEHFFLAALRKAGVLTLFLVTKLEGTVTGNFPVSTE